ncbi:PREDICTED: tripartite motif-containing protein 3-like [Branchiostoma belcheri]|uniref:RING-type E3 ubiquitin transferase n=1 Tax=Branchiostoma belcheri TaxID=7741 RepID=A0A6P4YE70_BRABE|nr:PREDICTED: tripartite motif-containing protein 3-like [Branchiostoma belcheri]
MADTEASFRKQVRDEFLSCSICLEPFHHPKTLPCLHTFCEDCLRDHAEVRPGFQCPTCRRQVVLCPDGVAGLPDNHFISSLCDTVLEQGTAVFESHCRAHPPEELKLFCTDCEAVICSECWDDKHPNHTVTTARKAAETKKAAFSDIIAKGRSCLQEDCDSLRQLRTLEDTINENKAKVEGEVTEAFDELIRQLTERKENLLEEVNKNHQQNVAGLEEKKDKLLKQVAELSSACDKTENAMEQGGGDFLRQGIELTTTFGDYEENQTKPTPLQTQVTSFQPKGMNVQIQEMGELRVDSTITASDSTQRKKAAGIDTNSTAWRRSFLQLIIGLSIALAVYNVSTIDVWFEQGKFDNPSGVSMFRNDVLYIADESNYRIKKVDHNGQYLGQMKTLVEEEAWGWHIAMKPFAVALGWDDNLWVVVHNELPTDFDPEFAIARYNTAGEYLGKVVRFENPKDVAVDTNRKYVIVIDGSDVKMFDLNDKVVHLIKGEDFGMQNPQHITVTQVGDILVSDTGKHKIFMFSGEGQFLRSFGGEGSGEGELRGPRGICTDSSGNIIVADEENSRIELFDGEGRFIRHAVTDVKNPVGVAVSQSGHLVVTRSDFHGPEAVLIYNSY